MNIKLNEKDKIAYFKGLLSVIVNRNSVNQRYIGLIHELAELLGIDGSFCNKTIDLIKADKYIMDNPPKFGDTEIAKLFVQDAISIAFADKSLHLFGLNWIKFTREKNSLDAAWCINEINLFIEDKEVNENPLSSLKITQYC